MDLLASQVPPHIKPVIQFLSQQANIALND
jgi:hypothetical protein